MHAFLKKKNDYFEPESVASSDWKWNRNHIAWRLISGIFWATVRGNDPRNGIGKDHVNLVICKHTAAFTQRWKIMKLKTKRMSTLNMNERKWQQPWFQLRLTFQFKKSHSRWELGQLIIVYFFCPSLANDAGANQTFCEWHTTELSHLVALSIVIGTLLHVHCVSLTDCDSAEAAPYLLILCSSQILGDLPCNQKYSVVWSLQYLS